MKSFVLTLIAAVSFIPLTAFGQGAGRAGTNSAQATSAKQKQTAVPTHADYITVTGAAEISVKPESLRLVFAIVASAPTSEATAAKGKQSLQNIRDGLAKIGIQPDDIVEDFIAMKPRYQWKVDKAGANDKFPIATESQAGFDLQSNLHVLCKDERQALSVIDLAFQNGVSEIVSFDYWHPGLDEQKRLATKQALAEAQQKADVLLAVFPRRPTILNVSDSITVSPPQSLYKTINETNASGRSPFPYEWNRALKIYAQRPKITYYAGNNQYSDVGHTRPPLSPEISIHAQVTLTYSSPARDQKMKIEQLAAESNAKDTN